jgi:prepilin-type N-terminal cleavage/methylation domain-containing protein
MQKFKIFHSQFNIKRSKGFTFVEIIVVLVILAILAAVFIPSLVRYIDMSKEKSDLGTLGMLNRVTTAYRTEAYQNDTVADPFLDEENDSVELMNELVSESFLSERLVPLLPKAKFEWSLLYKQWTYVKADGQTVISLLASQEIIDEYLLSNPNNPWIKDTLGLASKYGLIFIPNNKESYTITSRAKLTVGNNLENNGGYGIAFETTLSGNEETGYKETGYIAQFDRGRGAIVIRKRLNGV